MNNKKRLTQWKWKWKMMEDDEKEKFSLVFRRCVNYILNLPIYVSLGKDL